MLANTARGCVENCDILQLVGLPCGQAGPNKNVGGPTESASKGLGSGAMAGIGVVVVILLVAVLFGAIFYYRRKYKVAKVNRVHKKRLHFCQSGTLWIGA